MVKAHRLLYHSVLGSKLFTSSEEEVIDLDDEEEEVICLDDRRNSPMSLQYGWPIAGIVD